MICGIALNAAENYTTYLTQNATFARAAGFLSLLKNSTNFGTKCDQHLKPKKSNTNKREKTTSNGGSAKRNNLSKNVTFDKTLGNMLFNKNLSKNKAIIIPQSQFSNRTLMSGVSI
jgi:hypothetical protein